MLRVILLSFALSTQPPVSGGERNPVAGAQPARPAFPETELFSKGGVGIVSNGVYVVVKSARNELILGVGERRERWTGRDAASAEVVFVVDGKAWSPQELPANLDLSKAAVVSFEGDKVRCFDFADVRADGPPAGSAPLTIRNRA